MVALGVHTQNQEWFMCFISWFQVFLGNENAIIGKNLAILDWKKWHFLSFLVGVFTIKYAS